MKPPPWHSHVGIFVDGQATVEGNTSMREIGEVTSMKIEYEGGSDLFDTLQNASGQFQGASESMRKLGASMGKVFSSGIALRQAKDVPRALQETVPEPDADEMAVIAEAAAELGMKASWRRKLLTVEDPPRMVMMAVLEMPRGKVETAVNPDEPLLEAFHRIGL